MSQLSLQRRQPKPPNILVENFPVKEGKKFSSENEIICIGCGSPTTPEIYDDSKIPLVLKCTKCNRKSWAIKGRT